MNLALVGLDAADEVGVAAEGRGRFSLVSQAADVWLFVCVCVMCGVCVCVCMVCVCVCVVCVCVCVCVCLFISL